MKRILLVACLSMMQVQAARAEGSVGGSVAGSATSLAGIRASQLGSVMAVQGSLQASAGLATAASQAIHASVIAGQKIVISAVEVSGNLVRVTYKVSIQGSQLALQLGRDTLLVSVTFARQAFEASLRAAGTTLDFLVKGVVNGAEVVVRATAIVAGSAGVIVGHTLSLAATPLVSIGVVLNDLGRDLYNN